MQGKTKLILISKEIRNRSDLTQKGSNSFFSYNKAKILQCGNDNDVLSTQDGYLQKVCVEQIGYDNRVGQVCKWVSDNLMKVEQGDHLDLSKLSYSSEVDQYQDGRRNKAYASQYATDNKIDQSS